MWQAAEELLREVHTLLPRVKAAAPNAADRLDRSAESVLFNIGEGAGAFAPKVKIAAYEIAKREANEARAILRALVIRRAAGSAEIARGYNLAGAIVGMLTRAIISLSARAPRDG
jgi:four helix bundle protein